MQKLRTIIHWRIILLKLYVIPGRKVEGGKLEGRKKGTGKVDFNIINPVYQKVIVSTYNRYKNTYSI